MSARAALLCLLVPLAACGSIDDAAPQPPLTRAEQAVTAQGDWSGFGTGQCVSGVYTFYENRFGVNLNPCCLQGSNLGTCENCGACMIWQSTRVQPDPALFNRYAWGSATPQTYDIVVYPSASGTGYGHVACVDHLEGSDASAWQNLYVMDSNYLVANQQSPHIHTVNRAPYGFYRLKSLDHPARVHHQRTRADINGDGKADVCARGAAGIACWHADGTGFPVQLAGPPLSDAEGWGVSTYYGAIRYADVNGDGKADICARGGPGFSCWLSDGTGFPTTTTGPGLADAQGFAAPEYGTTVQLADVNGDGKDDVCARTASGFDCWLSTGTRFGTMIAAPDMSDAQGWSDPQYYATIQMADVNGDGKADVCGRGSAGFKCWLSTGAAFVDPGAPYVGAFANPGGSQASVYATLQMADVNGDGLADVCGRTASGFSCFLSDGTGGFPVEVPGPALSNAEGWSVATYYGSIQMGDVNGDGKADVCARAGAGVLCWLSDGAAFSTEITGPALSDASGWSDPSNGDTLQLADVNGDGMADVCGRANAGWDCWLSTGAGFATQISNSPPISDAAGWSDPRYYSTVTLVGGFAPATPATTGGSSGASGSSGSSTSSSGSSGSTGSTRSTGSSGGGSTGSTGSGSTGSARSSGSTGSGPGTPHALEPGGCGAARGSSASLWALLVGVGLAFRRRRSKQG